MTRPSRWCPRARCRRTIRRAFVLRARRKGCQSGRVRGEARNPCRGLFPSGLVGRQVLLAANPWRHPEAAAHATCHGTAGGEKQGPQGTRRRHAVAEAPRAQRMDARLDGLPRHGKTAGNVVQTAAAWWAGHPGAGGCNRAWMADGREVRPEADWGAGGGKERPIGVVVPNRSGFLTMMVSRSYLQVSVSRWRDVVWTAVRGGGADTWGDRWQGRTRVTLLQ